MAKSDVLVRMKADVSGYDANIAKARRSLDQFKQDNLSLGGVLNQTVKSLTAAAAGFASLSAAAGAIKNLIDESVQLAKAGEGVRIAFERLNEPGLLDSLRTATHNTVTDIELMKAAVKFNDFKLPVQELGTMLAFAQQKAKDTGQSIDYMVDSIVTGLGRKSLMILDNLGLSASEIREKMKETGDMTKAVGEIIREQMAKAGDYMETAADRAAQANTSLQNKMEELGRKFAPLQEASNNLWTSIKLGIMDIISGPLTTFINKMTEAGRIANQYGILGGNAKVGKLTSNLAGAREENRQSIYQQQQQEFWRYINRRENYMKDRQRWINNPGDETLRKKLLSEQQAFGTDNVNEIKAQITAARKMLADYQQAAKTILSPEAVASAAITSTTNTKSGKGGKTNTGPTYDVGSLSEAKAQVQELTKAWNDAGAGVRDQYLQPLIEAEQRVKDMQNAMNLQKEQAQGRLKGGNIDIPVQADVSKSLIPSIDNIREELEKNPIVVPIEASKNSVESIAVAAKNTAQVVGTIGQAFNQIEDPAAKVAGTVAMAIAQIALAYGQAMAADPTLKTSIYGLIAGAAAAMISMTTTIANVHSATGYANGGIVEGNTYSGDQIPIMANAGEIVLNASQQSMLANNIKNQGGGGMRIVGVLKGHDMALMLDRWGMTTGRGELLFGKNI